MNETLCRALLQARLTEEDVATHLQVDPKTVRRWLEGRVPYLRHRWALAALLGLDEADLWPHLRRTRSRPEEVQAIYPHLDAVPEALWLRLFRSAEREIGILADSAQPVAGNPRVLAALAEKAAAGVRVRVCLPDPTVLLRPNAQHRTRIVPPRPLTCTVHSLLLRHRVKEAWRRSGGIGPSCTPPSSTPTTNSWPASTLTASLPRMTLSFICSDLWTATCAPSISAVLSRSGLTRNESTIIRNISGSS